MSKLLELLDVIRTDPDVASATLVIWSVILGIIIAILFSFYNRRVLGSFFRALIRAGADEEENAKTHVYNCIENEGVDAYYEEWEVKDYV
jgi:ABC-type phosphate/phosphonate transport system permease subunit